MMIRYLMLAIGQLNDPKILRLLGKVVLLTLALLTIFGIATYFALQWAFAQASLADGGLAAAAVTVLIVLFTAIFLFRIIAMFVLNIFSDEIVDAVEARHYPDAAVRARPPDFVTGARMGLASAGRAIGYNLLAAPIYLLLLVTGFGTAIAFFAVNALLIGRDLQDMVAARHQDGTSYDHDHWQIAKLPRFLLGLLTALLLAVPVVNFLAPILGAAMATHLVHQRPQGLINDETQP